MADAVEFGQVVDLTLGELAGTELVADAAVSATSLLVDYAGDFEPEGLLLLNGVQLAYTEIVEGEAEADPDEFILAVPLAAAATADDRVGRIAGGEPVYDWLLHVDLGDGDPVDIPIPFEQRTMWSLVNVSDNPVPVVISADLESLLDVPGRVPQIDGSYVIGGSLTVTALQTSEELDEPRVLMNNALGAAVRLYTGDANEGYEDSGEIRAYLSGSGGTRRGALEIEAPNLSDLVTPTSWGTIILYGESADHTVQSSMLATAKAVVFNGTMQIDSLADGGVNNAGSGAKYCRVGADGALFSSTSSPSSRTVKHDIQDLNLDQEALLSLRPVTFRYNDDPSTVRVGFIAEEAHDLGLHALVGYEDRNDADNPTGFDYDGMGAALLLVVQRQQERLDTQRDRIKALEDRLDALEN